ncbi:MAG: hypothetical protein NkDv07_0266 [Candidatus Improbicoccus devescovinae]|nr:MAG: hypothetical protein NkDv07_0266 [Candidatus Improbicoccus devescovinae]
MRKISHVMNLLENSKSCSALETKAEIENKKAEKTEGFIIKKTPIISEYDLKLINKFTKRNFDSNEIYIFSVVLCDNEIDRDFERFNDEALDKLAKFFVGKTGITDHNLKSNNQTARIFECKVEILNKNNSLGQNYRRLVAKAYIPRHASGANDLILSIDAGIKKEVSINCSVKSRLCSICKEPISSKSSGFLNSKCKHMPGKIYNDVMCHVILNNPVDAYEWSFVVVPAQREAGVIKCFSQENYAYPDLEPNETRFKDMLSKYDFKLQLTPVLTQTQATYNNSNFII